jgi:hypothetical protein
VKLTDRQLQPVKAGKLLPSPLTGQPFLNNGLDRYIHMSRTSHVVSFVCPDSVFHRIDARSRQTGRSVSHLIREAVETAYPDPDEKGAER